MSLQEIVVMIHEGEYGRAIASLEHEVNDPSRSPRVSVVYCKWVAEFNRRLVEDRDEGVWYVEAVRIILSEEVEQKEKAKEAIPLCTKAMEAYGKGGDAADVLVAARLKQYLVGLSK